MRHALSLGRRGAGNTWPNPAVGCVIVAAGRVVGRGWTAPGGRPHAETQALSMAGDAARGATAYVSLEPCAHHGRTPPCADALVAAGVARVVTAMNDPDPRTAGQGHARLRDAGIEVTGGVLSDAAAGDHLGFVTRITQGRPMVTLKLASSFDGRIATASGESRWITGPQARRAVHTLRMRHDAVLVGGGTARADDPDLTVRAMGAVRQPVRLVASRHLNLAADGRLGRSARAVPVWLLHGAGVGDVTPEKRAEWESACAELMPTAVDTGGQLDPQGLLATLADKGLTSVLCEGGGALAASLLTAGVVDRLVGFTAGLALGAEGRPSLGAMGLERLADGPRFELISTRPVGGDVMHVWARR